MEENFFIYVIFYLMDVYYLLSIPYIHHTQPIYTTVLSDISFIDTRKVGLSYSCIHK